MSGLSDRLRIISSIGSKYFLDGGSLASNRRGSHRVRVWLGNGVGGVDRRMDRRMDWLNWDDRGHWDNWSHWGHWDHWGSNTGTERGAHSRGGAGLVGPGVVGDPLGGHEVLAGGVSRVHVAPLSPGGVDSQTVALDHSSGVPEGQAAALAAAVNQWRGGLLTGCSLVPYLTAAPETEQAGEADEGDVPELHGQRCSRGFCCL